MLQNRILLLKLKYKKMIDQKITNKLYSLQDNPDIGQNKLQFEFIKFLIKNRIP